MRGARPVTAPRQQAGHSIGRKGGKELQLKTGLSTNGRICRAGNRVSRWRRHRVVRAVSPATGSTPNSSSRGGSSTSSSNSDNRYGSKTTARAQPLRLNHCDSNRRGYSHRINNFNSIRKKVNGAESMSV